MSKKKAEREKGTKKRMTRENKRRMELTTKIVFLCPLFLFSLLLLLPPQI